MAIAVKYLRKQGALGCSAPSSISRLVRLRSPNRNSNSLYPLSPIAARPKHSSPFSIVTSKMKTSVAWILLVPLTYTPTFAQDVLLPGYGNYPWTPVCAQACLQAFRPYWLSCTDSELAKKPYDPVNLATPPSCYTSNPVFLTSAAWCFHSRCTPDITIVRLEAYWQVAVPGSGGLKQLPPPMWSYTVALDRVNPKPPTNQLVVGDIWLNETSLLPEMAYVALANGMASLIHEEVNESKFRYL